jgi:hypothetical protein
MYKTIATIMVVLATEMSVAQPHQDKLASYSLNKQNIVDEGPSYYKLSFADCKSLIPQKGDEIITEANLNPQEISLLKTELSKAIKRYNKQVHNNENFKISLGDFGVQYIAYFNGNGEKIIWINGFNEKDNKIFYPKEHINYSSRIIGFNVLDGGNGYFNTFINLSNNKVAPVSIHGFA